MKTYITIKEAAQLLGITPQTLRNWEIKGELVPLRNRINNYRIYEVSQIEAFIENMRNERLKKGRFKLKVRILENES